MRVLIFGASITQGFWDIEGGWVSRIRKYYDSQKVQGQDDDPPTIFNLGVSGDSSEDLLARFDNEIKARNRYGKSVIVISIGINDSRTKAGTAFSSTDNYAQNLAQLLELARQYTSKILFVGLTPCVESRSNPVAWGDTGYTNERILAFDKTLKDFCHQNNVEYIEVFSSFQEQQKQTDLLPDGIHPNDKGHELIYDAVLPRLQKLVE